MALQKGENFEDAGKKKIFRQRRKGQFHYMGSRRKTQEKKKPRGKRARLVEYGAMYGRPGGTTSKREKRCVWNFSKTGPEERKA